MIGFLGGKDLLTPSQLVTAVQSETEDGKAMLEILEHGMRREPDGIQAVLARLGRQHAAV